MIELTLNRTPPSLNRSGRSNPRYQHRLKIDLQREIEALLMASKLPRNCETVRVIASLRFPTRRIRDEGNWRWMLEKSCGDALKAAWIPDDGPAHFSFGALTFESERGPARTRLFIEDLTDRQEAA